MKHVFILLLIFLFSLPGFSQDTKLEIVLRQKETKVDFYEMADAGSWVLYLPMTYGKSTFSYNQESAIKKLKNAIIGKIDLVYSDYPANQDFTPLNKKRLESLKSILPFAFTDPEIQFSKVRQTIAKTKATAEGLQHGFFIYFRPKPTKEETAEEIKKIKELVIDKRGLGGKSASTKMSKADSILSIWCGASTVLVDTFDMLVKGSWNNPLDIPLEVPRVVTRWATKDYIKKGLLPEIDPKDYEDWDSVYHVKYGKDCPDYSVDFFLYQNTDSTVSSVLKRHKWNKAMVVADVTGSMYPYTAQLLQWLKLNLTDKEKRYFIFFNDGDNKPDTEKVTGKTGGIYSVITNNYDEVEKTIEKAMLNGSGGDAPENNIEALLEAEKVCNVCDSIVMIVDNWASVKDISLLSSFHKPVKVVVCGVIGAINKDYLKLVRETKGSLHLIEEDITGLSEMKEGETIKIHGRMYKLIKGDFVEISGL